MSNYERLIDIMARLRGPSGCPWDKEQTHQSLKPYLIEEAYELLDAIDRNDDSEIKEELGDLLLQVVFHAQIASEENRFTTDDVAEAIADKLIRRHPHVFGDTQADTPDEVIKNWEAIKAEEKPDQKVSLLDGVPQHLPALLKARRLQEKAARVGFEWEHIADVAQKVREETEELMHARESGAIEKIQEEFGDLLFALVNLARFLQICPEEALIQTNRKFQSRFQYIETELCKQGKTPDDATLEEMDALWEAAKKENQPQKS